MDTKRLARISTLLDEAVEECEGMNRPELDLWPSASVVTKIREAQALLLGEKPVVPGDN